MSLSKWWQKCHFCVYYPFKRTSLKNEEVTFSQKSHYRFLSQVIFQKATPNLMVSRWAGVFEREQGYSVSRLSEESLCASLWCWEWPGNSLRDYSQHQPGQMVECLFTKCNFSQSCAKCSARLRWSVSFGHTQTRTHTFTWDENKPNCCLAHSWPCMLSNAVMLDKCKCVCVCMSTVRSAWEKDGQRLYPTAGAGCVYLPQSTFLISLCICKQLLLCLKVLFHQILVKSVGKCLLWLLSDAPVFIDISWGSMWLDQEGVDLVSSSWVKNDTMPM